MAPKQNRRRLSGFDVDTDALAASLRRIADGIEDTGIALMHVDSWHDTDPEDASAVGLSIEYAPSHAYVDVVDVIRYAVKQYLRFGDEFIPEVISGDHRVTLRYEFERDFDVGDEVDLIDRYDDKFGEVTIEGVFEMKIRDIPTYGLGHDDVGRTVEEMRRLYDDDTIDADTVVTVLLLGDVDRVDGYDLSKLDGGDHE